jgi:hypothetical protein
MKIVLLFFPTEDIPTKKNFVALDIIALISTVKGWRRSHNEEALPDKVNNIVCKVNDLNLT